MKTFASLLRLAAAIALLLLVLPFILLAEITYEREE